jgi:hypothetical protein
MRFARFVQFAAATLTLLAGTPAKAVPLTYGTYYDETVPNVQCPNTSLCRLNFSQLPADKLLVVQRINCAIASSQPVGQAFLEVSATFGGGLLPRYLPILVPPSQLIGSTYWTNFREETHFLIGQGRFPFLQVVTPITSTNTVVQCTIIGELVTPIQ